MSPEVKKDPEEQKPDIKEQKMTEFVDKNDLNSTEQGILAGLNIRFEKDKEITPDDINSAMDARFTAEIGKAGLSGQTSEMTEGKKQLSEQIAKTTDMKEKIALYQEFLDGLKSGVGTLVAEQKQNSDAYSKALQEAKNLGKKTKELQLAEETRKNDEKRQQQAKQEQQKLAEVDSARRDIDKLAGWPGEVKESQA
ncbi:MAG: hypothetical protein PHH16_00670 [Candidatus Gracilibacteria bacterium]|nr:hypothetical protein [Candidatus Gracilibacteria bacterium]